MKKKLMFVASMAMAVVLMGCGGSKDKSSEAEKEAAGSVGSAKGAAEQFVNAVIKCDVDKAVAYCDIFGETKREERNAKEKIENGIREMSRKIDDDKLEGKAIQEEIFGGRGYEIVNGKKYTDRATVVVQFVKEKDKKTNGMKVELMAVDGSWKVKDFDMVRDDLDTED